MLTSAVLVLRAVLSGVLPDAMGHLGYGLLRILAKGLPDELAPLDRTPEPGPRPFCISPLFGHFTRPKVGHVIAVPAREDPLLTSLTADTLRKLDHRAVKEGKHYWIRFTALTPQLSERLQEALARLDGKHVTLGSAEFVVSFQSVQDEQAITAHPEVSLRDVQSRALQYEEILESSPSDPKISLRFTTPTTFRVRTPEDHIVLSCPLPVPRRCFQSWINKWNHFSTIKLDREMLLDLVEQRVMVTQHNIATRAANLPTDREVGYVGTCTFRAKGDVPKEKLRTLNALADFAFFSGTGVKASVGMGQTLRAQAAPSRREVPRGAPT